MTPAKSEHLLIFVPGIMGTELTYEGPGPHRAAIIEKVWSEDASVLMSTLRSNQTRLAIQTELVPGKVIRKIRLPGFSVDDVYGNFLDFVSRDLGYKAGVDFETFGYDWRQSNRITAERLASFIGSMLDRSREIKIVAHSMGGLIVRLLLGDDRFASLRPHITSFIQIGSPVTGSSRALATLKGNISFGTACDLLLRLAQHLNPQSYHNLIASLQTFPSLYELLPHDERKCVFTASGDELTAYDIRLWPHWSHSELGAARSVQAQFRACPDVEFRCIYSVDVATEALYSVDYSFQHLTSIAKFDGDGTVLVSSATHGTHTAQCTEIKNQIEHDELLNNPIVWKEVRKALGR
jgi:hypothetical protein